MISTHLRSASNSGAKKRKSHWSAPSRWWWRWSINIYIERQIQIDRDRDRQIDIDIDGWIDRQIDEQKDRQIDRWIDIDGQMDRQIDGHIHVYIYIFRFESMISTHRRSASNSGQTRRKSHWPAPSRCWWRWTAATFPKLRQQSLGKGNRINM